MPVFRLSRALGVGRNAKVFLNMQGGLTRGVVPDPKQQHEQAQKLRRVVSRQKKTLQRKNRQIEEQAERLKEVISRQRETLRGKDRQIEEQAAMLENLRAQRQGRIKLKRKIKEQRLEIFGLRNELDAMHGSVGNTGDATSAAQASDEPGLGAPPDFVIIGAQKGGTSLLYRLLIEHPLVEPAATKELHFFDNNFSEGLSWYARYFPQRKRVDDRNTVSGEATPSYLLDPLVPERMAKTVPDARLIALLRNPVNRAYSQHQMRVRRGDEIRSFGEATQ